MGLSSGSSSSICERFDELKSVTLDAFGKRLRCRRHIRYSVSNDWCREFWYGQNTIRPETDFGFRSLALPNGTQLMESQPIKAGTFT